MSNSKDAELELLLKLLAETEYLEHNHPFVLYLQKNNIKPGPIVTPVEEVAKHYDIKLNVKTAIRVCSGYLQVYYIQGLPHFSINKPLKKPKRKRDAHNIKKFDNFLRSVSIAPGRIGINKNTIYNFYDAWAKKTQKQNPFTKKQLLEQFKREFTTSSVCIALNRDITKYLTSGEVATWRKRAKKEKA